MNQKIDFNDIPKNYLYCTHNKCPRRNECLRHQATLCIPQNVPDFRTVNPNHIIGNENTADFSIHTALHALHAELTIYWTTYHILRLSPSAKNYIL